VARGQTIRVSLESEVQCGAIKLKAIVHEAEEGGYWAEVPSIPGCATQGETFEELLQNLYEAVEGCLSVDVTTARVADSDGVQEIAI
jgi:predicted RNase H-like HicB family nuclease